MGKVILDKYGNSLRKFTPEIKSKKTKKIKDLLKDIIMLFSIAASIATIITGLNMMNVFDYYGISHTLFTFNIQDNFVGIIKNTLVWIVLIGIPYILNAKLKPFGIIDIIIKTICLIFLSFLFILCYSNKIFEYLINCFPFGKYLINEIICLIIIFFTFVFICFFNTIISLSQKKLRNIKKILYMVISIVFIFCLTWFYFAMYSITSSNILSFDLSDKVDYELLNTPNNEDKVVLFKANDKLFIADFKTENNTTTIYTKHYMVIDFNNVDISNIQFKNVVINKFEEKPKQ